MSVGDLVRRRGFRDLLVGQGVSALGDWMGTFAFMALTLRLTGSPAAVGGILTLRLLPAVIGGPLATRAVAKWDRLNTMLAMDVARCVLIAAVPLIRAVWWIYALAFLIEIASIVFLPARDASIPDLVDEVDLPVANGLILGSSYGTIPLGALAFALVAAVSSGSMFGRPLAVVFWIDAATYLVSFLCLRRLTMLSRDPTEAPSEDEVQFRAAFRIPLVRAVMPATAAVALGLGALFSLGIVFVREVLDASDAEFGVLIALFGVGAVGGLAALQARRGREPLRETRLGVAVIGVVVALFSLAGSLALAFVGAVAFGAAAAFTLASGMGALQSKLEGTEQVAAFAAFHVVIRLALGIAAVAAGLAGDALGSVDLPIVGVLEPSRVVLLASGLVILGTAAFVREHAVPEPETEFHAMSVVAIVTDGAAALPAALVARWGITVVPMWLTVGGEPEPEGTRGLDELLRSPGVLTSAPTPGEFEAAIKECLRTADAVLVCTISDSMSATNEAARLGSASLDGAIAVLDTRSAAGGQALVVLAAAAAAAESGATLESVTARAQAVAERVRLIATLPSLDHLVRSGRVPGIAGWAGKRLGINPLFEFRDGAVQRLRPALSSDAAAERMISHVRRTATPGARLHVTALHAMADATAHELLDRVVREFAPVESFVGEFGPVMVVHTGPGLLGLAWWWEVPTP